MIKIFFISKKLVAGICLSIFVLSFGLISCSSSSSDDPDTTLASINTPISGYVENIDLTANDTNEFLIPVVNEFTSFEELTIDLTKTLEAINLDLSQTLSAEQTNFLSKLGRESDANTMEVSLRIGTSQQASTVCQSGIPYGPISITLNDSYQPQSVQPSSLDIDLKTLSIINIGTYAICVQIASPVDIKVSAEYLALKAKDCIDPADIAGSWSGTYSCSNSCDPEEASKLQEVSLYILQQGTSATYSDDEANYSGIVCGNKFKYTGSGPGYDESGVFTLLSEGTAKKTSNWIDKETDDNSNSPRCSGDCTDSLSRN